MQLPLSGCYSHVLILYDMRCTVLTLFANHKMLTSFLSYTALIRPFIMYSFLLTKKIVYAQKWRSYQGFGSASLWCRSRSSFSYQCGSGSCSWSRWSESATISLRTLQASIFEHPCLHFERPRPSTIPPRKLLNLDFNADPDPAFHQMRIRIQFQCGSASETMSIALLFLPSLK